MVLTALKRLALPAELLRAWPRSPRRPLPDFPYAQPGTVSCGEDGVALGEEPGAVGGMDGSLEAASLADLKGVLSVDKQATLREALPLTEELWLVRSRKARASASSRTCGLKRQHAAMDATTDAAAAYPPLFPGLARASLAAPGHDGASLYKPRTFAVGCEVRRSLTSSSTRLQLLMKLLRNKRTGPNSSNSSMSKPSSK
jgi:hypothetical protein